MSLMSGEKKKKKKKADADVVMMHLDMFQRARKQRSLFFPSGLETVPALNCNGLLFTCHCRRERKLNEWN